MFPPCPRDSANFLDYSLQLSSALDLFDQRKGEPAHISQDFGQLRTIDDRLSLWGWQTATGVRFIIIVAGWREGTEHRGISRSKGEKGETGLRGACSWNIAERNTRFANARRDRLFGPFRQRTSIYCKIRSMYQTTTRQWPSVQAQEVPSRIGNSSKRSSELEKLGKWE